MNGQNMNWINYNFVIYNNNNHQLEWKALNEIYLLTSAFLDDKNTKFKQFWLMGSNMAITKIIKWFNRTLREKVC